MLVFSKWNPGWTADRLMYLTDAGTGKSYEMLTAKAGITFILLSKIDRTGQRFSIQQYFYTYFRSMDIYSSLFRNISKVYSMYK